MIAASEVYNSGGCVKIFLCATLLKVQILVLNSLNACMMPTVGWDSIARGLGFCALSLFSCGVMQCSRLSACMYERAAPALMRVAPLHDSTAFCPVSCTWCPVSSPPPLPPPWGRRSLPRWSSAQGSPLPLTPNRRCQVVMSQCGSNAAGKLHMTHAKGPAAVKVLSSSIISLGINQDLPFANTQHHL